MKEHYKKENGEKTNDAVSGEKLKGDDSGEIIWHAPEYLFHEKNSDWFWLSMLIGLFFLGLAIWQKNFLFALFVIIAEAMVINFANRLPRILEFKIDTEGIAIETGKDYTYDRLENFWIRPRTEEYDELIIKTKANFNPYAKILLEPKMTDKIKEALLPRLKEEKYEDTLIDAIQDLVDF